MSKSKLKISGWVNIYQDDNKVYHGTVLYESEDEATKRSSFLANFIGVAYVEQVISLTDGKKAKKDKDEELASG